MAIDTRPYYGSFAWAYDLLNDHRAGAGECASIVGWLTDHRIQAGAAILDAGCGTGRYAAQLAQQGYFVTGIDAAKELIAEAEKRKPGASGRLRFFICDILRHQVPQPYDGALCRGVLNDLIDESDRSLAFAMFARVLRPGGVLILDVREWAGTLARKTREPVTEKRVNTVRGALCFRSVTGVDCERRLLRIAERHTLSNAEGESHADHDFLMRCWTREDLNAHLVAAGFTPFAWFDGYTADSFVGDRLVVTAVKTGAHEALGTALPQRVFHVSDRPDIASFVPRPPPSPDSGVVDDVVWAIGERLLHNYLLPRDCPRVTFYAGPRSSAADIERYFVGASAKHVVAIEAGWLQRVRRKRLWLYEFPPESFVPIDDGAGYFVSPNAVTPIAVTQIDDILGALAARDVELRVLLSLWKLRDAILASSLEFSFIRMRKALPRETAAPASDLS